VRSGANLEFALRIKPGGHNYAVVPADEDLIMYLKLPIADFSTGDVINIRQTNTTILDATGTMLFEGIFDLGDPLYLYAGLALNAPGGMDLSSLNSVTNAWSFVYAIDFTPAKTSAQYNQIRVVDQTNNTYLSGIFGGPAFSSLLMSGLNQLTNTAVTGLPVDLLTFSGYKDGSRNQLKWTTSVEQNNKGFEVQRSLDGVNYTVIDFVNSLAPGGSSLTQLNYMFADNNVTSDKQYYRLRQIDFGGHYKFSNIVLIKGEKPTIFTINGIFPNPATTVVNLLTGSPAKAKATMVISDMSGRVMMIRSLELETGSNTLPVDVSALSGGTYMVKMISSSGGVTSSKFVKQ